VGAGTNNGLLELGLGSLVRVERRGIDIIEDNRRLD